MINGAQPEMGSGACLCAQNSDAIRPWTGYTDDSKLAFSRENAAQESLYHDCLLSSPRDRGTQATSCMDQYAAGAQALGYMYQPRLALLLMLRAPEELSLLVEINDDLEFLDQGGQRSLASLKHKREGDRLTDRTSDFWKSVNIWLQRYESAGLDRANMCFFLFTTDSVSRTSFLNSFVSLDGQSVDNWQDIEPLFSGILTSSASIKDTARTFYESLSIAERIDFLKKISILDASIRIENIPDNVKSTSLRAVRPQHRDAVFSRLEGWWQEAIIQQLTSKNPIPIFGRDLTEALARIADEYQLDNLPIEFFQYRPDEDRPLETDNRRFVVQMKNINLSNDRIQDAILDYYRAFHQRSSWVRQGLVQPIEIDQYEDRLKEEWRRAKNLIFSELSGDDPDEACVKAGRLLYNWAEHTSIAMEHLRIKARVNEPYVIRGSFHLMANVSPIPAVHWHPRFLDRIAAILEVAA